MKIKKTQFIIIAIVSIICIYLLKNPNIVNAQGAGFTVSANIPNNQYDNGLSSFDLIVRPKEKQTLVVTIENLENKNKIIKASANTAYTNPHGVVAYDKHQTNNLSNAKFQFNEIFDKPQMIHLKPYETKNINFTLKMPEESYSGILDGALYFKDIQGYNTKQTNLNNFRLINYYSMAIGIILREHPNTHVSADLKLRRIRISEHNQLQIPAVLAKLENIKPATTGSMKISATISKRKNSKILFNNVTDNRTMATKSYFEYGIPLKGQIVRPGKYHLHLVAKSHQRTWVFDREFTISARQAIKINSQNRDIWWILLIIILIILFFILLILTYYLGYRRRKLQENRNQ